MTLLSASPGIGAEQPQQLRNRLPALGDASSAIVSLETERRLGEQFLRSLRAQVPTYDDALIKYYTEFLLYRLAEHSDLESPQLTVVAIDSDQLNAFAAPGGVVGVNLGLFLYASNVHEFASVLAHELAHLSQRHFARGIDEQRKATLPYMAALLASVALMATVGSDAGLAALTTSQAAMQQGQLRYSRQREAEADRLGIDTLARAGFDPHAMADMFGRMNRAFRFDRRPPEFLLTHPVTESRMADARNQAAQYTRRTYPDDLDFQLLRSRVRIHFAETPADAVRLFRAEVDTGRAERAEASTYGLALSLSLQNDHDEAIATLQPLIDAEPQRLAYLLAYTELLRRAGRPGQALGQLERELRIHPDNYPISMQYARVLDSANRHSDAEAVLQRQSVLRPTDDGVWFQLAETAGLAGDIITVHRARAEYFQLNGNLRSAIQHLEYALKLVPRDNFTQYARLQQRAEDLKELRREQS